MSAELVGQLDLLAPRRVSVSVRKANVLALLHDGQWHATCEICAPHVGGSEGTRRLRELRAEGHRIVKRHKDDSDQWDYRLERR